MSIGNLMKVSTPQKQKNKKKQTKNTTNKQKKKVRTPVSHQADMLPVIT